MQNNLIIRNNEILKSNLNEKELKKHLLIKKLLEDNMCFFKIKITTAFKLLKDLKISDDDLNRVYKELINYDNFKANN